LCIAVPSRSIPDLKGKELTFKKHCEKISDKVLRISFAQQERHTKVLKPEPVWGQSY
jgi:hypothetical protein